MITLQNLHQNRNANTSYSWEQYKEPVEEFLILLTFTMTL